MTFTIGRASFTGNPNLNDHDGDLLQIGIDILPSSLADAKALRQQVLGLAANPDENVVPVTWSGDADYDGFYRVLGVRCEPVLGYLTNKLMRCQIDLERVKSYGLPTQEMMTGAILRTNGHSITVPDTIVVAFYVNTQSFVRDSTLAALSLTQATRSSETGNVTIGRTPAPVAISTYQVECYPADQYKGAALIEVKVSGTWYKVIGNQVPYNTNWRISNGIVRFTSQQTSGTHATLEVWNGSAWESMDVRHWEAGTTGVHAGYGGLTILKNAPDQVIVRAQAAAGPSGYFICDYSVKRGHMHIECNWRSTDDLTTQLGCGFTTAVASTDITGAIRATSNDANGNRLVFGVAAADSTDLVNGRVWPTSTASSGSMFMGVELNGSGAAAADAAAELLDQFHGIAPSAQITAAR